MAKKTTQTLGAAAGEPQGYLYPGTITGRKIVFEELTIKAMRQLQAIGANSDANNQERTDALIDVVFDLLCSLKVKVVDGEPFVKEKLEDEVGVQDVTRLFRFFTNPRLTLEELTAEAPVEGEEEDDPKAE